MLEVVSVVEMDTERMEREAVVDSTVESDAQELVLKREYFCCVKLKLRC